MRYDGTSGAPLRSAIGAVGTAQFTTPGSGGLSDPHDLAFGPDGNLYVASLGSSAVIQYDGTTGALLSQFVTTGVPTAHGVEFGRDENLYVASFGSTGIAHFEGSTGAALGNFVVPGVGGMSGPADLVFCPRVVGDLDGDGDVDLSDLSEFAACVNGPQNSALPPGCIQSVFDQSDLDNDTDVDLQDFAKFIFGFDG